MFKILTSKRNSISPLIATILLVVVAVVLMAFILKWGKTFTSDKLPFVANGEQKLYIQPRGFSNNQETHVEFKGNWEEATAYCAELDANQALGYTGWRFPTPSDFTNIWNSYVLNEEDVCLQINGKYREYIPVQCINQSIKSEFPYFMGFEESDFVDKFPVYWTTSVYVDNLPPNYPVKERHYSITMKEGEFWYMESVGFARCVRDP